MVVLVTGGSGFIGSHIIDKLIEYNHTVRVLDKKKPLRDDLQFVQGSITDKEAISFAMKDVDVIYHLAAASNIDLVKDNPSQTIEYNVLATAYLLDEARIKKIKRFILASSVMVYEMKGHIYTFSKYASEQLCINFQLLYDLPFTILRIGTVYGPRNRRADVVSIFIENALRKNDLYINPCHHTQLLAPTLQGTDNDQADSLLRQLLPSPLFSLIQYVLRQTSPDCKQPQDFHKADTDNTCHQWLHQYSFRNS